MKIRQIVEEDFVNYKEPSLFIGTAYCNWKCCVESGLDKIVCQNESLSLAPIIEVSNRDIFNRFVQNPITKAIVIGGLEPVIQWNEIISLVSYFRRKSCTAEFVIYTGYYPNEIEHELNDLRKFSNIVMKFGRFIPGHSPHYDEVLGVSLASDNQYGERIS